MTVCVVISVVMQSHSRDDRERQSHGIMTPTTVLSPDTTRHQTPASTLTLKTSNDAVLRKEVPFEGYKSEISYLTEFYGKFGKIPLFQWENFKLP